MRETTHKLLRILVAERIPATGFVNEAMVVVDGELADRTALLTAWLDGGFDLGNHTYSHVPIDRVPFEVYKANLIKREVVTRRCSRQGADACVISGIRSSGLVRRLSTRPRWMRCWSSAGIALRQSRLTVCPLHGTRAGAL